MAQKNNDSRQKLIVQYKNFILKCASKTGGRFVDESDDLYAEALIAFNDAINTYNAEKGSFLSFAAVIIHNRLINYLKSEQRFSRATPFSGLTAEDDDGTELAERFEDKNNSFSDTALEIFSLDSQLSKLGISFSDLADSSPKQEKTVRACLDIASYIASDKALLKAVSEKGTLPVKLITTRLGINKKVPERHRKYIISAIFILGGNYEILSGYLKNGRKVR